MSRPTVRALVVGSLAAVVASACGGSKDAPVPVAHEAPPRAIPSPPFELAPPRDRIVSLGRNDHFACVVRASGGVDCWGQLGVGRPEPVPRRIPGVTDAVTISDDGTCVIRKSGEVACLARSRLEWIPVPGVTQVARLSSGGAGCYVHTDGGVSCTAYEGQLPVRVPELTDAVAVALVGGGGGTGLCVVRIGGKVVCGNHPSTSAMPLHPLAGLPPVKALTATRGSTSNALCAVLETGAVSCFSVDHEGGNRVIRDSGVELAVDRDQYGQAITGWDPAAFAHATAISVEHEPVFSVGQAFVLEAIVGGKVVRWQRGKTSVVPDLVDAVQLASGCAVRAQGSVVCWGSNAGGVLGQPTTEGRYLRPPTQVVGLAGARLLARAPADGWAVTTAERLMHWGGERSGWATEVPLPAGLGSLTSLIATEGGSACVIAAGDAVWCSTAAHPELARKIERDVISIVPYKRWVVALHADLSISTLELDPAQRENDGWHAPDYAPAPSGTVRLIATSFYVCAVQRTGEVACWDHSWVALPGVARVSDAVAGFLRCVLQAGAMRCFSLADDAHEGKPVAEAPTIGDAVALAAADDEVCAVRAHGRVTCYRGHGFAPIEVLPSGATALALAGGQSGCALMQDGTARCWGTNTGGALGDGSIVTSPRPLAVPGL